MILRSSSKLKLRALLPVLASLLLGCGGPSIAAVDQPSNGGRIVFLGDSWLAGVGVAKRCYPRLFMDSDPCSDGESIADDIARMLHAQAYQNLALGGAYLYDAQDNEVQNVDPSATLVIILIGFNDEKAMGDQRSQWNVWNACNPATRSYFPVIVGTPSCPDAQPWTASIYNPLGFTETPPDMAARAKQIILSVRSRNSRARIIIVSPADTDKIPVYTWTGGQRSAYRWSETIIDESLKQKDADFIDLSAGSIYDAPFYVPSNVCPTANVGNCVGHPNSVGAMRIASFIVAHL